METQQFVCKSRDPGWQSRFSISSLFLVVIELGAAQLLMAVAVAGGNNTATFSLSATSHWDVPFPSDYFVVPDGDMLTGIRVDLPLPTDPTLISEIEDTEAVNTLDGFSVFPRITIPLSGADPDPNTFTSANVFLLNLNPTGFGTVIPIDQRLIDDSVPGSPRLIFTPDVVLPGLGRFAIVVKTGLLGVDGTPFNPNPEFEAFLTRFLNGDPPGSTYESALRGTAIVLEILGLSSPSDLASLSVFTTRTVADVPLKLLQRLDNGEVAITDPNFELDAIPGPEIFNAADILEIHSFLHRGSLVSNGSAFVSFPPNSLRIQDSAIVLSDDLTSQVYVQNMRNETRMQVPNFLFRPSDGSIRLFNISSIDPQPGDELALFVRKPRIITGEDIPYFWGQVGSIALGAVNVPRYFDETGLVPTVPTGPNFVPAQTGTDTIIFSLFLPDGPPPPGGWSVTHFLHGGAETKSDFFNGLLTTGPVLAALGVASAGFAAAEFGGGVHSFIEIETTSETHVIPGVGRGLDQDGDGFFERTGYYSYPQRLSDLETVIRALRNGVDFDHDGESDLATTAQDTSVAGISYGGAAAMIAAAVVSEASTFVANVPAAMGSRGRSAGYHPVMPARSREFAAEILDAREPSLLNGASPILGGDFDENVPMKRGPVRVGGMVPGAEAIQRSFDFQMWRDLQHIPYAYADTVRTGVLRGGPARFLLQIVRGDGAANNMLQSLMILSGKIASKTAIVRLDREPAFDDKYREFLDTDLARHLLIALPYNPSTEPDIGGLLSHSARIQIAEYIRRRGFSVPDPDQAGVVFSGDVFESPISNDLLEEMLVDPGFPQ